MNGRFVRDRLLGRALSDAYRNIPPPDASPEAVLFVETPPDEVDVNVHPQKMEVRFRSPQRVMETVTAAIQQALGTSPVFSPFPSPSSAERPATAVGCSPSPSPGSFSGAARDIAPLTSNVACALVPAEPVSSAQKTAPCVTHELYAVTPAPPSETASLPHDMTTGRVRTRCVAAGRQVWSPPLDGATPMNRSQADIRILGRMHDSYIVATDVNGLLLIDQHVAHERILFERQVRALSARNVTTQMLLSLVVVDLTPTQFIAFERLAAELEEVGFRLTQLADRTVVIQGTPADLTVADARDFLIELLDTPADDPSTVSRADFLRTAAAGPACRAAVKIRMELTPEKMTWPADELFKCEHPTTRPTAGQSC